MLNIASALIKQVLTLQDFETWTSVRKDYLPSEYHTIFSVIDKHCDKFHTLPTFEDLKFEVRDPATVEKLFAIESVEVEADAFMLLQYLKNEYTQKEILDSLETYIDNSVAFEDAEESVAHLHQIVLDVEKKVDLQEPQESMQRIALFENDDEIGKYLALGLNADYDREIQFSPKDLFLSGVVAGLVNRLLVQILLTVYLRVESRLCISLLRWIADPFYKEFVLLQQGFLSHGCVQKI